MFYDGITKDFPKNVGGLLDDTGVGNDINDAAFVVTLRVFQREGHTGKRLAATGRYGEREQARCFMGFLAALSQNVGAQLIDRRGVCCDCFTCHESIELFEQGWDIRPVAALLQPCLRPCTPQCRGNRHRPGRKTAYAPIRRSRCCRPVWRADRARMCRGRDIGRWIFSQGLVEFIAAVRAIKTRIQPAEPVVKSGVMAGDKISQYPPRHAEAIARQHRTRSGMRGFACLALDMGLGVNATDFADVMLKAGAVLAQVVPQPCKVRPILRIKLSGMTSGQCRHAR